MPSHSNTLGLRVKHAIERCVRVRRALTMSSSHDESRLIMADDNVSRNWRGSSSAKSERASESSAASSICAPITDSWERTEQRM